MARGALRRTKRPNMTTARATFGRRILILTPHPDDEVVACAAAIGRAKAEGAEIFTLYLTDGCLARKTMWPWSRASHAEAVARRRREGEAAAKQLGVSPTGWMTRSTRRVWRELPEVEAEIRAAIQAIAPDQLWVPAYEGGNPDHDALNALGASFTDHRSVLEFAEYNFFGGRARAQEFPFPRGDEQTIVLTPEERRQKSALLRLYASERGNLNYVGVARECFRPIAAYDYSRPPHPGVLWYTRYQWVPFRHPRVDFTPPDEVSRAIVGYLGERAGRARPPREAS